MPPTCCESNPATPASVHGSGLRGGWTRLAIGVGVILVLWLAVLPRIADQPAVRRHIQFLEQQRVDPSAMFYTELDTINEVRSRMTQIRLRYPASFWQPALGRDRSRSGSGKKPHGASPEG